MCYYSNNLNHPPVAAVTSYIARVYVTVCRNRHGYSTYLKDSASVRCAHVKQWLSIHKLYCLSMQGSGGGGRSESGVHLDKQPHELTFTRTSTSESPVNLTYMCMYQLKTRQHRTCKLHTESANHCNTDTVNKVISVEILQAWAALVATG